MLTVLDAINSMLATIGEFPLNTIEDDHPLVPIAKRVLSIANAREQAKAWWFNTETITLHPDSGSKYIYIPADAIRLDPLDPHKNVVQRGRRFYDPNRTSFEFDKPIRCILVREVPFQDLPITAQIYINVTAQFDFQKQIDADVVKAQALAREKQETYAILNSEHIRNVNANLLETSSFMSIMNTIGNHRRF